MSDDWKSWWRGMLKHPSWQKMRLEVMQRAGFKCEKIGCNYDLDETNPLNVHHKYYDEENRWLEPWKYPRGSLQCLCERHHREVHGLDNEFQHNYDEPVNLQIEITNSIPNYEEYEFTPIKPSHLPKSISRYNKKNSLWMECIWTDTYWRAGYPKHCYSPTEQGIFQRFDFEKNKWFDGGVFFEKAVLIKNNELPDWALDKRIKKLLRFPSEEIWTRELFGSEFFYEAVEFSDKEFASKNSLIRFFNEDGEGYGCLDNELVHLSEILELERERKERSEAEEYDDPNTWDEIYKKDPDEEY